MQHIGICFNQINFQIQIFQVNSRQKISYKISTKQIQSINQSTPAKSEGGSDMWSGLRHKWLIQQSPCLRCITRKCEALGKGNKSNEIHRVPCQQQQLPKPNIKPLHSDYYYFRFSIEVGIFAAEKHSQSTNNIKKAKEVQPV